MKKETRTAIRDNDADTFKPPDVLEAELGWIEMEMPPSVGVGRSFVSGEPEGDRLRVRYFRRERDNAFVGKVWFGPGSEGPPGHAHGGSIASVLDEAMLGAAFFSGNIGLAVRLVIDFKQMVPIGTVARFEADVDRVDDRKIVARVRLLGSLGEIFADGEGLFIKVGTEKLSKLASIVEKLPGYDSGTSQKDG